MARFSLVAFDLDGVLVDGTGSWSDVHKALGTEGLSLSHGREFYEGKITFDEWARKDTDLWNGVDFNRIQEALYRTRLMKGAKETISTLKNWGYRTAIISGGLQILADRVREELGIDYAVANRLLFNDNKLCGIDQRVDFNGKGRILEKIMRANRVGRNESVAVGDYINDISLFEAAGYSIAFNPKDGKLLAYADEVILEKDLTRILPLLGDDK